MRIQMVGLPMTSRNGATSSIYECKILRLDYAESEPAQKEFFSSWALFILIVLLILALFTSYMLQQKKVQAVHETVISIFAGR
jgi:hypothetical protein